MPASILSACRALRSVVANFDAGAYSGADCAELVEELSATEKACAGARLLAASRAIECKAHEQKGFGDGADWLATQTGTTPTEAKRNLNTAGQLGERTKDALLAGKLSLDQAEEITNTAKEAPDSEGELVNLAGKTDLSRLRYEARDRRLEVIKREDLHRRQHKARRFHAGKNWLGMITGSFELPPEVGLPLIRRLELRAHKLRQAAKQAAKADPNVEVESWDAYAADALVELLSGSDESKPRAANTELFVVCDLRAWRRGHTHEGEPCHILDGGPIPVDLAKQLSADAFLNVVLHDGVDIITLTRLGRHIPAHLRAALDLGDPPDFTGKKCADCGKRHGLQLDHVDPVANDGPTSYANLKPRCYNDHRRKTEQDRDAGLLNPGRRRKEPANATDQVGRSSEGPDPPQRS